MYELILKKENQNSMNRFSPNLHGLMHCNGYAFQGMFWREANYKNVVLHKVYQQKKAKFVAALTDMLYMAEFESDHVVKFF